MRVAIIGGGIAGTSAGYFLAGRADVTVLEQETTCGYHTTGRSAALFTECYGDEVVRRLAIGSRAFLDTPPDGFAPHPIVTRRPVLFVATQEQADRLTPALHEYQAMVATVDALDADTAIALCPVLDSTVVAGGVVEPGAGDIDVHALHLGYQRGIKQGGGRVLTGAPAVGFTATDHGWIVHTPSGDHEADVVVNAAGAWCDVVGSMAGTRPIGLVPMRRTAFTFPPPPDSDHTRWPMVIDLDEQFYFRPEGPQVLASPCDETPMEPHDVRHEEIDVALGIERVQSVTTMRIRSVAHAWAGLRSFVADHRPVNGWDPEMPGFYWLAGQGGFGIKSSPAMGRFAAAMILDGGPPPDLTAAGVTAEVLGVARLDTGSSPGHHVGATLPS